MARMTGIEPHIQLGNQTTTMTTWTARPALWSRRAKERPVNRRRATEECVRRRRGLGHDASVEIHELGLDDGDLLREAVRRFRRVELDETESFLSDPATIALAMVCDREVVGWVWGNRQRHAAGYSQVQLYEIEVVPEHRGRGVGRALLSRFRDLAASEGHRKMWLFTDDGNAPAKALYQSIGGSASPHEDATFWWQRQPGRHHEPTEVTDTP